MTSSLTLTDMKLKRIYIQNQLPAVLSPLQRLSHNIWWSWNFAAQDLFHQIDPERFRELNYNPVALLETLDPARINELAADTAFIERLQAVEKAFDAYLAVPKKAGPKLAYFSMEYGLHISLKLYSGGLGVLAGDYLKEASDSNVDLFAVGLLYRYGYFNQGLSMNGDQIHLYPAQKFTQLPVEPVRKADGNWLKVSVPIQGRIVQAKIWKLPIGRINLYLLDTDHEDNSQDDRALTHMLYGGDNEHRLKQEILLGIGGVRAIEAMGLAPEVYHLNEGHAGFLSIERLKNFVAGGLRFPEAVEAVRASSLYTTHTPVPAGHDHFSEHLLRNYLYNYAQELGITWEEFVALGRKDPHNPGEDFNMSNLSIALSQRVNGVSKLHGEVSQEMFTPLYPGYTPNEVHIGYVTNSVHYPTWIAHELHELYSTVFGKDWLADQSNKDIWRNIHKIDDKVLFEARHRLKVRLLDYVREKLKADMQRRGESPRMTYDILSKINNNALVLGFARRFATYKRATLLFQNEERLKALVNRADQPVIFLFAGKAHPADQGGQDLIRRILHVSKKPEFAGKIIFLEDYNMEMAKLLTQGVDIWLNTPTRPLEASGTSGMKAALNGSVNFSVLDGWWAEGYRPDAGWALPLERTYQEQHLQNELDAELIYHTMEEEIIPTYFQRDATGISSKWMHYVKQIIAEVAPTFTMKRMMDDYYERFYFPLAKSQQATSKSNYAKAKAYAAWKEDLRTKWSGIEVLDNNTFDTVNYALPVGETFNAEITIDTNGIDASSLLLEVCFYQRLTEEKIELRRVEAFELKKATGNKATFALALDPRLAGVYEYGFRLRPQHELMPHAQDLNLVFWV
ncbi:alpha-glucan family phosphorylase [Neolewinella lacunae]|uniref:glycogen phosphorylase n=2 Tax=Neolewinella lacunae TaxID=1517758 RepID=A0A923T6I5_9BACT|nr:alpha-glucan family phosphorylase [Neolewinella lacunae]MBC6993460.1 alpha-glucan family phosphorylase [Neolewinella lacunae]MDN3636264.1 alpha-glucan family phosphorylase [Neolewinella lacunae]